MATFQSAPRASREANTAVPLSESVLRRFQSAPRASREANLLQAVRETVERQVSIRASRFARGELQTDISDTVLLNVSIRASRFARGEHGKLDKLPTGQMFQSAPRASREANLSMGLYVNEDHLFQSAPRASREANPPVLVGMPLVIGFNPRLALRARRTGDVVVCSREGCGFNPRLALRARRT